MARKIGAALAGMLVVGLVVFAVQALGAALHPLPEGVDPMDPADRAAFEAYVAAMPVSAWLLAAAAEVIGAFLGALTAARIAPSARKGFAIGIVLVALVASVANWVGFPHPTWFIVGQMVAYPLVLVLALRIVAAWAPPGSAEGVPEAGPA